MRNSANTIPRGAAAETKAIEEAITKARRHNVHVSPARAIAMAGTLFNQGKHEQAEQVCRQIIAAKPELADPHNMLGVTLNALGRAGEAVASLEQAIRLAPNVASYHANLGEVLRQQGQAEAAEKSLHAAIEHDPASAQALNNLGIIHYERRQFAEAVDFYRRALAARPTMAEAWNNLGNALRMAGDPAAAMKAYQDALTHREIYPEAYNNLGTLLQQDHRHEEAERALKKAIAQNPHYIEAHNALAQFYASQNKDVEALRILGEALKFAPRNVQTLLITARIQNRRGNFIAAEKGARAILAQDPAHADALVLLGQLLHETDRYVEALDALSKAVELAPDNPEALNFYGVALKSVGRLDEAKIHILKSLELNGSIYGAYANLNDLVDFSSGVGDELFQRMDAIMSAAADQHAAHLLPLHFAYAKALEDRGEHARALDHYILGGRMKRQQLDYDEVGTFAFFDSIKAAFPKEVFLDREFEGASDDRLVFIVGMPRSGSTLTEQIIASHPAVHGAGEVKHLSRTLGQLRDRFPSLHKYPHMMEQVTPAQLAMVADSYLSFISEDAGEASKITDKLLTNYFFVGLINLLFPNAKIVHTVRNPLDTCLSAFTKLFKDDMPHSYDLGELGRYYAKYRDLMAHWEKVLPEGVMHTVTYEEMVADTEGEAKRLVEFLGLEWDIRCLEFYKSSRPVKTASVAQVRKPIYKSAVARWKRYGDKIQPLVDAVSPSTSSQ
ncbi:tetratricopeptide repeat-containing sulfotransferase family protein [Sphingomonas xanthus]|uniref:Tetratricopeptide repeat protein n=1 Tax=Sphingomonas xanthus TaxID=2594473 RepID=A0A516ITY3_9SPHN|nr:tetratricopeptide repeat-containing sulfotransferase family protein [Sphingomonas xanthus]QDP20376.1 tetratricopeptide repeat protein [Sphingomonas xanthus]